jgi:tetratricopeptide (TPR) repeat protein
MDDCATLEETLAIAQRVLASLEKRAAGYTSLTTPSDLSIELDDKRQEVDKLKARLDAAKLLKQESQRVAESDEVNRQSPMRSLVPDENYIERDEAKGLLTHFAAALNQPQGQPLLFNICGIGGVGKTTLLGRLRDAHVGKVDFLEICFAKTAGIEKPLKLMRKLHQQAMKLLGSGTITDAFTQQDRQFEETLFELSEKSINGEANSSEDKRKIVSWFERLIWLDPLGLTSTSSKPKSFDVLGVGFSALAVMGEDAEGLQEWIQQRVRNHPATKDQPELQSLMLEPVPRLTQAFADSLIQISQSRGRSLVLILDTYEKTQSYLNQWLWQYLVEDTPLYSAPVRLVVVGRRSLQADEGWRKLNQDRKLLHETSLTRFSQKDTKNYLTKIGIEHGGTQAKIFKVTQGLPYYLDWVRKQHEEGKELDFSRGNQAIAELLLQGIYPQQRKILQVVACCRWFDLAMIRYLLSSIDLGLQQNTNNAEVYFEWLKQSDFVEFTNHRYGLDDVARNVFRQSYFQDDQTQFRKTNALIAEYFKQQADKVVDPQSLLPDPYRDDEWRGLIAEFLYYGLFGKGREGLQNYIEQVFTAVYLREPDVFIIPFAFIRAEMNEENQNLLPKTTYKFFKDSGIALGNWPLLTVSPQSYKINFEGENIPSEQEIEAFSNGLETSIQSLLDFASGLNNSLGKCVGMGYKFLRCNNFRKKIDLLLEAKSQSEQLLTYCHPQLVLAIFLWISRLLIISELYEEALESSQRAIELDPKSASAWEYQFGALNNLERYEEALESSQKVIDIDPKSADAWINHSIVLNNLERYEEALESSRKAIELDPKFVNAWTNQSISLCKLERYEEALESSQRAIELDPKSASAWIHQSFALANLKRQEEALESSRKAIELDPKSASAWTNQSGSLAELERYEEALESSRKAIELDPKSVNAWTNQSISLCKLERYEEALESSRKAIELDPKSASAWNDCGNILRMLGQYEESITACDKAFNIDPNDFDQLNSYSLVLSLLGNFEKAITLIDKAIILKPQKVLLRANRGIILARASRYIEALTECEQAINQNPKHESGYYAKACYYALQGDADQAIENLQQAIDITPRHSRSEAKHNPDFDSIRDDERFRALVYPEPKS